ncbi:hypothetical protein BX257_1444 [Streptomyces sp. 3212.3]|nr:hypothetical protein BX257_1444 [Streptomyces sp. 3212.3]
MPPAELTQLVHAPGVTVRNQTISAHLRRMETELERTRTTVASLRRLLEGPPPSATVTFRTVPATRALGIRAIVSEETGLGWVEEAHHELRAALAAAALRRAGPDSALFAPEMRHINLAILGTRVHSRPLTLCVVKKVTSACYSNLKKEKSRYRRSSGLPDPLA